MMTTLSCCFLPTVVLVLVRASSMIVATPKSPIRNVMQSTKNLLIIQKLINYLKGKYPTRDLNLYDM